MDSRNTMDRLQEYMVVLAIFSGFVFFISGITCIIQGPDYKVYSWETDREIQGRSNTKKLSFIVTVVSFACCLVFTLMAI